MSTHRGRVAIVTGAAKGIGRELSRQMAERGASLLLLDLDDCSATYQDVLGAGGEVVSLQADVTNADDWRHAVDLACERFGRVDILINNAGIYPSTEFDVLDYALWRKVMNVNLDGAFLGAKAVVPTMKQCGWGRIVNIASSSICTATQGISHYMASKMGVIGLTRGLANDLGQHNITVNAVAPALTETPGTSEMPDAFKQMAVGMQSIKRQAMPNDIVGPIMFLCSDDACFVTGQLLAADGGMMKIS